MKLENIFTADFLYESSALIMKISGYSFISIKLTKNGKSQIFRQRRDYAIFILSLLFSLYIFYLSNIEKAFFELESTILNLGTYILWEVSMTSIIVTKFVNLFKGPRAMSIIVDFKWIDQKVWIIISSLYFCDILFLVQRLRNRYQNSQINIDHNFSVYRLFHRFST